jgi:hypothetical protein
MSLVQSGATVRVAVALVLCAAVWLAIWSLL